MQNCLVYTQRNTFKHYHRTQPKFTIFQSHAHNIWLSNWWSRVYIVNGKWLHGICSQSGFPLTPTLQCLEFYFSLCSWRRQQDSASTSAWQQKIDGIGSVIRPISPCKLNQAGKNGLGKHSQCWHHPELERYIWDKSCGTRSECSKTSMYVIICVFLNCRHLITCVVSLLAWFFCWFGGI